MKVTALVPAYNEEALIGKTIGALARVDVVNEIVVVDDGSTDATARLADETGATVIRLDRNLGKGDALNKVLSCSLLADFGVLALVDADVGETASEVGKLIQPIIDNEADMTIGVLPNIRYQRANSKNGKKGGFGLVKGLARWGIRRATGQTMAAPLSGQRALRRSVLERVGKFAGGFGMEVALTIDALKAGFRVQEVPVAMTHEVTGRNIPGFFHRGRQFAQVLWVLSRRAFGRG